MWKNIPIRFKLSMAIKVKSSHLTPFVTITHSKICSKKWVKKVLSTVLRGIIAQSLPMARQGQAKHSP